MDKKVIAKVFRPAKSGNSIVTRYISECLVCGQLVEYSCPRVFCGRPCQYSYSAQKTDCEKHRASANYRGLEHSLTEDEYSRLRENKICFYCGGPANGIDRIHNDMGYHFLNCVTCCGPCNKMKFTSPIEEFMDRIKAIAARLSISGGC